MGASNTMGQASQKSVDNFFFLEKGRDDGQPN
jgi:hypothetical protein